MSSLPQQKACWNRKGVLEQQSYARPGKGACLLWTVDVEHEVDSGVPQSMHIIGLLNDAGFLLELAQHFAACRGGHVHVVRHARNDNLTCREI